LINTITAWHMLSFLQLSVTKMSPHGIYPYLTVSTI